MALSQPPTATPNTNEVLLKPSGNNVDMAWEWNHMKDLNNKKSVTCNFCGHTSTGGITRAKNHQMGVTGDVGACKEIPPEIKQKIMDVVLKKKADKDAIFGDLNDCFDDMEEVQAINDLMTGKQPTESARIVKKAKSTKGPLDLMYRKAQRQTSINDAIDKEARARTVQFIARFFYKCGIPFNVVRDRSFKKMMDAVANYGPNLKLPSYHELRVPLLQKEVDLTNEMLQPHIIERASSGCSIMSDAWTDRKGRTLINFMVNCPLGTMFVKSVDASGYMKTGEKLAELLDSFICEVGEERVVQVVTDNGSNYVLAGKYLELRRHHIFWTPCAAHCVDLMLEDIGKLERVKRAIQRGSSLVSFIYNHTMTLNTMRKFTKKTELVRPRVTRFATNFLTLQRLHDQKGNLRKMFTSDEWMNSNAAKDAKGKRAFDIVMMTSFWSDVLYCLKAMGPLVKVLRLVDNEKHPAMGYIYEAMDRAKEVMIGAFQADEKHYNDIFDIIDRRWQCQLHHPLHAAGHFLNPKHYYKNPAELDNDSEVTLGLYKCIERLCVTDEEVDKATNELSSYRRSTGTFSLKAAIRQRDTLHPAEWWNNYGTHVPTLRKVAMKVLNLTCSSSGCERNWSTFEQIHSKKRSKLEHQKLQDLVFVKYNQTLKERFDFHDLTDVIKLNDIDDCCNEWLTGKAGEDGEVAEEDEFVFPDDILTWEAVSSAVGAGEPSTLTRQQTRQQPAAASGSRQQPAPSASRKQAAAASGSRQQAAAASVSKRTTLTVEDRSDGDDNVAEKVYNLSSGDSGPNEEDYLGDSDDY